MVLQKKRRKGNEMYALATTIVIILMLIILVFKLGIIEITKTEEEETTIVSIKSSLVGSAATFVIKKGVLVDEEYDEYEDVNEDDILDWIKESAEDATQEEKEEFLEKVIVALKLEEIK
jgi:hypothetical protein